MRNALLLLSLWLMVGGVLAGEKQLLRIEVATVASSDLNAFAARYERWLGYRVRERGKVSEALAKSWGARETAGRPYLLMSADGAKDVYVRAVESDSVPGYQPMTTWGWNSIEIIVDDPRALHATFEGSPFEVIGGPKALSSYPTIVAFQVVGPDQEVLYLTAETGDRQKSLLPLPNGDVGRPFIMILAGPDIDALLDWYADTFHLERGGVRQVVIGGVARAQGLTEGETVGLGLQRLEEQGNLIEFDGYSRGKSGPRPFRAGDLPPGVAMTTFAVRDLDALDLDYVAAPQIFEQPPYDGRRAATVRGPAGELIELVERDVRD